MRASKRNKKRESMTLVCVSLAEQSVTDLVSQADLCKSLGANLIELRLDKLKEPISSSILNRLSEIKKDTGLPLILTIRPYWDGGDYKEDEEKRTALLEEAITTGFDYIDLELKMEGNLRDPLIALAKKEEIKTIISYHDFFKTPSWSEIFALIKQCKETEGDIAKVVLTSNNFEDVLNVTKGGKTAKDLNHKYTVMGMGSYGQFTRVLAPLIGCEMVYAAVDPEKKVEDGQVDIRTLLELWDALENL
ncbi:MAG: type I 3-dehydroquinate dehydratase [Thermoplasmata archaeon]|nr:MAG: type I 3-dehydroquinate dehydratase [Thermoplasmata archaeon]